MPRLGYYICYEAIIVGYIGFKDSFEIVSLLRILLRMISLLRAVL